MKVVAAPYLVALNVNLQNGAGLSDPARCTLALTEVLHVIRANLLSRAETIVYLRQRRLSHIRSYSKVRSEFFFRSDASDAISV